MVKKGKKYPKEYYQKLNQKNKELIYECASRMASGFLSFDTVGGGAVMLAGRLACLQAATPWLIYIATKMANEICLFDESKMPNEVKISEEIELEDNESGGTSI